MELVYVWIEKYKNIEQTGFNLSPNYNFRFLQSFDSYRLIQIKESNNLISEIEYEKNEVKIPKEFFGKNISNVSVIIGKNGSGKSSLSQLISNAKLDIKTLKRMKLCDEFLMIFKDCNEDFYALTSGDKTSKSKIYMREKKSDKRFELEKINYNELDIIYYDNEVLKKPLMVEKKRNIKKIDISSQTLLRREKDLNSFSVNEIKRNILFLNYLKKEKEWKEKIDLNIPKIIYLGGVGLGIKDVRTFNEELVNKMVIMILSKMSDEVIVDIISDNSLKAYDTEELEKIIEIYENKIGEEFFEHKQIRRELEVFFPYCESLKNKILNYQHTPSKTSYEQFENNNLNPNILLPPEDIPDEIYEEIDLSKYFNYAKSFYKLIQKLINKNGSVEIVNDKIKINLENEDILMLIIFLDETKNFSLENELIEFSYDIELSSGERSFLGLFSRLNSIKNDLESKNFLLVLDEAETFLHPEWQRKFTYILLYFLEHSFKDKKIQVILTSHSPFLASDLPHGNIILLESYCGKCKVKSEKIKTFGSNIFDLYRKAFFTKSTFGELARFKIKNVVELLTPVNGEYNEVEIERKKEEIEYVINSIGEKLISIKIKDLYDKYLNYRGNDIQSKLEKFMINNNLNREELKKYL